jgi:isovaleryl-CoA dehydrogenase
MIPNTYPTLDFDLGDTVDMLRESVRSFTERRQAPQPAIFEAWVASRRSSST